MLSSILFQDLGEKAGSFESFTQNEGYIQTPGDLNDYSLEEEKLVGGEVEEENAFEVKYVYYLLIHNGLLDMKYLSEYPYHIILSCISCRVVEEVSWEMVDQEGQTPSSAARTMRLVWMWLWEWEGVLAAAAHLNVTRYDACFYTLWNNYARLRSNLSSFYISIHIF